ncbi:MAG: 3-hydroxyacyl-CoA dehydrogenase [Acidobacteria bacterium]|nr:MAG: 3-hydroxyacyl-CoA dehydrogenase [Acidobacteriota bacterium]
MAGLAGRRALVTGGGRGIGRAVALDLARAGAAVAVAARTRADVEAVAAEARRLGAPAAALVADVTRPESVREMFGAAREALGPIDVLVCGAGVAPSATVARTTDEQWRAALDTNLSGCFYCLREALGAMAGQGWGRVVAVASIAGKTGYPYVGAYAASKHGVLGLVKCAALEVAGQGVTVNAVCPGYVDTPMTDVSVARLAEKTGHPPGDVRRRLEEMSPQRRLFTAEEVSALVLFLCGEQARGITGQALSLDGGTLV